MKLLYVASDQKVPGRTGGSVHVEEVARGLATLGHEVHVVALGDASPDGSPDGSKDAFTLHPSAMFFEHRAFRWTARRQVAELLDRLGIDAVLERYYNFGGEGIRAAHARNIPSLLEVNSPLKEPRGSLKSFLDGVLLVRPMRRLRDELAAKASRLVTPLPSIIPDNVAAEKVHQVNWGANVERFNPEVEPATLDIPEDRRVVVFSGSFRPWHGADVLVRAAQEVPEAFFLFVGAGPASEPARRLADELGLRDRVLFTGAVGYDAMPGYLKRGDVGVAPYQPEKLRQMQLGFYWSPLKIFEYMAMGMPVVTLDVPPLRAIIRPEQEGLLYEEGDVAAMARAITSLLEDRDRARAMGRAARERVVAHYSWQLHCEALDRILKEMTGKR